MRISDWSSDVCSSDLKGMRRMAHPSSRRGRRPADHGDTERSIRLAALTRFADPGFDATGLRDIAADAGVDVALISYKFGSKLALWKAVVERARQRRGRERVGQYGEIWVVAVSLE